MRATIQRQGTATIRDEARVLYTLLDAAASAGLMDETTVEPAWREANSRLLARPNYESEAEVFHGLMVALDASGALAGTWIEERWRTIQSRVAPASESAIRPSP